MNKRKYINFKLVNSWKLAEKYIAKKNFHQSIIFSKNLVGFYLKQEKIILDTLSLLVAVILEHGKRVMQEYHYEFFREKLNFNLLYTDTDSCNGRSARPSAFSCFSFLRAGPDEKIGFSVVVRTPLLQHRCVARSPVLLPSFLFFAHEALL